MASTPVIKSDCGVVEKILKDTIKDVIEAGGFVHPSLEFYCDRKHPYGAFRLEGVSNKELSLVIPKSLESWVAPHKALGRTIDRSFYLAHAMEGDYIAPLISMSNHSARGGNIVYKTDSYELYGTTHCYSERADKLLNRFGII